MTTNASQGDSVWDCMTTSWCQPNSVGNRTVWPRLETGKSSVTPWSRPSTIAWNVLIGLCTADASSRCGPTTFTRAIIAHAARPRGAPDTRRAASLWATASIEPKRGARDERRRHLEDHPPDSDGSTELDDRASRGRQH